jgi:hypothetical protein
MQLELRKIDGQDFILQRTGKKEFIRTPQEAVSIEQRNIADAMGELADRREAIAQIEAKIESALLAAESAQALRLDLAAAREAEQVLLDDIAASEETIRQVFRMIDDHEANEIRTAAATRLAAMLAPYDKTLKEFA